LPLRPEPVQLAELFELVARRFASRAREQGRMIETDGRGITVNADRLRFEQALGNMIENALRYGAGTVRVFAVADATTVVTHVTDEGAGLPTGFALKAFERFSRADEVRGRPGSGLGLAIVKAIAEAHGGTVATGNAPGGGADFSLSFGRRAPMQSG
jgi:two-component system OmpR family sensor kinase